MLPVLGIIAGDGDVPAELAKMYRAQGGLCFIASIYKPVEQELVSNQYFSLGSVGAILSYFNNNGVRHIVLVGGVPRPDLKSLKVDIAGAALVAKILKKKIIGDDNVLRTVCEYIESKGFKVISPKDILNLIKQDEEIPSICQPSLQDLADIDIGKNVLNALGGMDVGQSVMVCDGYVLGIEAAEGTDNLIKRCALLRKKPKGGSLIKMLKHTQDIRLDTPTIGPNTILTLVEHGFNGVGVEKNGVLIVKQPEIINLLNNSGLFLYTF